MREQRRWPNLFIVGTAKAATTSLYRYLRQHPDVYLSPIKEPNFFLGVDPGGGQSYFGDEDSYLELFNRASTEKVLGEASVQYLCKLGTAEWIRRTVPEAKILISLREPVSRAYSHYLMDVRNRMQHRPFLEALQLDIDTPTRPRRTRHLYVDYGRYCEQVARYLKVFGENVCVLFFEEFVEDTRTHLRDVFRFLEVDPSYADSVQLGKHNSYVAPQSRLGEALHRRPTLSALARRFVGVIDVWPRMGMFLADGKPPIDPRARQFLEELYSGEAECLERLLGRRVPWSSERQQTEAGDKGAHQSKGR